MASNNSVYGKEARTLNNSALYRNIMKLMMFETTTFLILISVVIF